MGFMTLQNFRDDIQQAIGAINFADADLDRAINFAYLDIASGIKFEILEDSTTPATVASTSTVAAPTTPLTIRLVKNTTSDYKLGYIPKTEYYRRNITPEGAPKHWSRHAGNILLHPVPDGIYNLLIIYKKTPTLLVSTGDTTVLPASWDPVIFLLAVQYVLLRLGQEQRAITWMTRAVSYAQTRMTEEDLELESSGMKSSVPGAENFTSLLSQAARG